MSDETRSLRALQAKEQPELELFEGGMRKEAVKELQKKSPHQALVLKLLYIAYYKLADWSSLGTLMKDLKKIWIFMLLRGGMI